MWVRSTIEVVWRTACTDCKYNVRVEGQQDWALDWFQIGSGLFEFEEEDFKKLGSSEEICPVHTEIEKPV